MDKLVELTILGEPMSKQRPKFSIRNGFVRTRTPIETTMYENLIATEYHNKYGGLMFDRDEPIKCTIVAYFGLSKADYGKKGLNKSGREKMEQLYSTKHKDIDNIVKICLDGLNEICFVDDKQVVILSAIKSYTTETPRVTIRLESAKKEDWKL